MAARRARQRARAMAVRFELITSRLVARGLLLRGVYFETWAILVFQMAGSWNRGELAQRRLVELEQAPAKFSGFGITGAKPGP